MSELAGAAQIFYRDMMSNRSGGLPKKVTVFEDKFIVEFKSGMTVDVDE